MGNARDSGGRLGTTPPKGSIGNPVTEADLPFKCEEGCVYWFAFQGHVEVRRDGE